jgi:hypothetical protein
MYNQIKTFPNKVSKKEHESLSNKKNVSFVTRVEFKIGSKGVQLEFIS